MKRCKFCGNDIRATAVKCTHCNMWQNWRGLLNFSIPVLSLLLAILSVIFSTGREFYNSVTYTPHVDAFVTHAEPGKGGIHMVFLNGEEEAATVNGMIACDKKGFMGGVWFFPMDEENKYIQAKSSIVTVPSKSEIAVYFRSAQLSDEGAALDCKVEYIHNGKSYKLNKEILYPPQ